MIGTEDLSTSAGMDISESFRAEDLSKTDFFDFVTAPDMGIGIGVGVGVDVGVSMHHHAHHSHSQHSQLHQQTPQTPQQLCGARTNASSMTHDGGGGGDGSSNGGDPTLQGYEFWHSDKEPSRLDSSSIFEDLDRYCWQQQPVTASSSAVSNASSCRNSHSHTATHPSPTSPLGSHPHPQQQQHPQQGSHHQPTTNSSSAASSTATSAGGGSSTDTISSIDNTDGQIYTLTVLNGSEPWLKRAEAEQLPSALDLDSLLGSFPGYIKSEYPYDDSGFSTDGTKDQVIVNGGGDANGLSSISHSSQHGQTLPSLVTAISIAGGGGGADLGQQLAQFQNNNNDWHMADHNAEQNSAESLLRSALQGKGYAKGLHMPNGQLAMLPGSPTVKEDDMRRLLFTPDAAALGFADSTLSAAQMFDDGQLTGGAGQAQHNGNASIIVDDMFLSLENAFSDDFEKIKRIANEVQQFCSAGTPTSGEYSGGGGDVLMQISPASTPTATLHLPPTAVPQPPPQPLKPEVSTSTTATAASTAAGGGGRLTGCVSKPKKQYKRTSSSSNSNNNNNNPNVINHNNNSAVLGVAMGGSSGTLTSTSSSGSSGSASSSSNSPPSNCNGNGNGVGGAAGAAGGAAASGGAQRKERSLHYCSICSKGFKDKYSVNVHIRTHTGEKPFSCSLCGKSFRQKAHLAKHYQTHMTQKNNGSIIKGNSAKHPRGGGAGGGAGSATVAQQRQLSAAVPVPSLGPVMSAGVVLNGPNAGGGGGGGGGVLPPANGLLANR